MASPGSPGGFFRPEILSPPTSSIQSSNAASALPRPRSHPLRSGGSKESAFIRYVDDGIKQVQRRYAKRIAEADDESSGPKGYENFREAAKDLDRLVDVVWISGTPSLQIPYLLSLALVLVALLESLPPSPKSTVKLLGKLDVAFASLLQGRHVETGEELPGLDGSKTISGTEKVRLKSLVDRTRICAVDVLGKADVDEIDDDDEDDEDEVNDAVGIEGDDSAGVTDLEDGDSPLQMQLAKVYERTVVELGDTIGATPIGIISRD